MYPVFSLWIRSHADLPLKTFQIVNTFRYETKQTRAFIRVREIHFFEAHTCHIDFKDAEKQVDEDKKIATSLLNKLSLPFIFNKRPEWDKFAGANYTISIDVLMPSKRTLQLGSIHQYMDNFSKPYNISYETENGTHQYCHQTTYGMSERILGAIIGIHGDNRGLILPPEVSPIQVVIIPIIFKGKEKGIIETCEMICENLNKQGIRAHIDNRDISPGSKYYDWELKGVPLRLELGPRDLTNNTIILVRRDTNEKLEVPISENKKQVSNILNEIKQRLYENALKLLKNNMKTCTSIDEAKTLKGVIQLPWCGLEQCALEIEEILEGNTLGEPIEKKEKVEDYSCPVCNKKAVAWMRYAKTY
jgi:prolyl-tRNA synthetase